MQEAMESIDINYDSERASGIAAFTLPALRAA